MQERLWTVSTKYYFRNYKKTVTVKGVPFHQIEWNQFDKNTLIEKHGMYRSCYKETEDYFEYIDIFYAISDAEAFAQASRMEP